jgi:DNA anti-recombination protein RmuC
MRMALRVLAAAPLLLAGVALPAASPEEVASTIDSTRATLARWLQTQQAIARERSDWQTGREVLQQRIALLGKEIATVEERIEQTRRGLEEAERKRGEITAQVDSLRATGAVLAEALGSLEEGTRRLTATLPDPLRERIRPLSQRLPEDPPRNQASLGERYQNVIGILNEVNKFNRDISVTSEIRSLPGGVKTEVQALYIGLAQAYYVTARGDAAGVGRPAPEGWRWTPADELADEVSEAIGILQSGQAPTYVPLPVEIK